MGSFYRRKYRRVHNKYCLCKSCTIRQDKKDMRTWYKCVGVLFLFVLTIGAVL